MSTFLSDDFTGGAGNLNLHSPQTGGLWVQHTSYLGCTLDLNGSGQVGVGTDNTDALYYNAATPGSADYDVTITITNVTNNDFPAAAGRINTAADTYYRAQADIAAGTLNAYKTVAGVTNAVGNTASGITWADGDTITLSMVGTTIVAKRNGTGLTTGTDSAISATGKAGLKAYGAITGTKFDLVVGVDPTGATAFTLTGPSAGPINANSTAFTVTPTGGNATGTFTPNSLANTTFFPGNLTWAGNATAQTFTVNKTTLGTIGVNGTLGNLTPPGNVSYTTKTSTTQNYAYQDGAPLTPTTYQVFNSDNTAWQPSASVGNSSGNGTGVAIAVLVPLDYVGYIEFIQGSTFATDVLTPPTGNSGGATLSRVFTGF